MSRVNGERAGAASADLLLGLAAGIGSADTAAAALDQIVGVGAAAIEGAAELAVVRFGSEVVVLAASGTAAGDVVTLEQECGAGPAGAAADDGALVYAEDLRVDQRWPQFGPRAVQEHGLLGMLCCPVADDAGAGSSRTALTVLAGKPNAFDEDDIRLACALGGYAALALSAFRSRDEAVGLQNALKNSREIGVAMGILMNRHLVTRDDAFAMLVAASQNSHRKLHVVAADVAESGVLEVPAGWNRLRGAGGQPVTSAHVRLRGDVALVIATGEFDLATAHLLAEALEEARELGVPVRLDMSAVSFVDASALDVVAKAQEELAERQCPFEILRPPASVLHSLRLANLDGPVRESAPPRQRRRG